jgi:glycosyltransferase involved in cell wall biosynthesis
MKIAWLIQGDEQWGIRSGSLALMASLRRQDVACPVIALGDGDFTEECKSLGYEVNELHVGTVPMFTGGLVRKLSQFVHLYRVERRARNKVAEALRALGADAIHFRRPNMVGIGGPAARANGIPAFWHIPNAIGARYPFDLNRRIYQSRCARYGIVPLANSHFTASTLGNTPVKPEVMYLAVDAVRFDPANIEGISRRSLGIGDDAIVCGVIARMWPNKGQDRAISAVLSLAGEGHDIHLLVAGGPVSGDYYERICRQVQAADAPERIHLLGPVSETERYYRLMDFSLNARIDPEPCGISVLESMMCETPALVHANGGPAETVVDGVTGWHYHGGTAADIRGGLLRAIGDRPRWPEIGAAARRHAIERFSQEAQAKQYLQIVRDTLSKRKV